MKKTRDSTTALNLCWNVTREDEIGRDWTRRYVALENEGYSENLIKSTGVGVQENTGVGLNKGRLTIIRV